jgi:DNA-binding NarL/FixJ family response regulator
VLDGLKLLIQTIPDYEVVETATSGEEALKKYKQYLPDIVLLDLQLPDISGINVCKSIIAYNERAKILMLTSFKEERIIYETARAGAKGFITKDISREKLIEVLEKIASGKSLLKENQKIKENEVLDEIETKILIMIAEGKTNREIAGELWFSDQTIKNYVSGILHKLGLKNRAEAAAYAVKHNLLLLKS